MTARRRSPFDPGPAKPGPSPLTRELEFLEHVAVARVTVNGVHVGWAVETIDDSYRFQRNEDAPENLVEHAARQVPGMRPLSGAVVIEVQHHLFPGPGPVRFDFAADPPRGEVEMKVTDSLHVNDGRRPQDFDPPDPDDPSKPREDLFR